MGELNNSIQLDLNAQSTQRLSKGDIFGLLQNDRRRNVLELLHSRGNQSPREISEAIACIESGTHEPKSSVRKSVYVSLLQTHLPKMQSLGVLVYDKTEDKVKLTAEARDIKVYMEPVEKNNIPWSQYYLGLSIFAVLGSVAVTTDLITWISSTQWMLLITSLFLVSAVAHVWQMNQINRELNLPQRSAWKIINIIGRSFYNRFKRQ